MFTKTRSAPRGGAGVAALGGFIILVFLATFALTFKRWEGQAPRLSFDREFSSMGSSPALNLKVEDPETGLRYVTIRLKQKDQEVVLADESFDRAGSQKSRTYDVGKLIAEKYMIQAGPASLTVTADDYALRHFLTGNRTEVTKDFVFRIQPPRLEVISGQHYINQGGSECVVYRVSDDAEVSGVLVGEHLFPGYPVQGDKDLRFALFALEYDWPADVPMKVVARSAAGNEATAEFWHKVFPKKFRSRELPLEDSFVAKVVPEIMAHTHEIQDQGDRVKTFLTIAKLSQQSPAQFLWNGPFLQLSNSKVESFFADRRTYVYDGKPVDQQDHVGFDLSVVQHNPIEAANDGKVVLADYFGIYGNAVVIDHGAGLLSVYGHMSEIEVKAGQMVKKKEIVGKSGATGLAAGDHLHFGLFLHGVPVNPTEWWDEHWIKDHVLDRVKQ